MVGSSRAKGSGEGQQEMFFALSEADGGRRGYEHTGTVWIRFRGTNQALAEYLDHLRQTNCPGCGRVQFTPRGEAMPCPVCVAGKKSLERPAVPMAMKTRRGRRV
jgi:hypothetical protein